tara:strand:- start:583 stop:1701 length:1119 start_codon:yes stop_codon:yes gene_type:complete
MITVNLPISKSLANRYLTRCAVLNNTLPDFNDKWSDDIKSMYHLLTSKNKLINVGAAGTAFRFGIAFWSAKKGVTKIITGDNILLNRPIDPLINSLRKIGGDIKKMSNGSFKISGKTLSGGEVRIDSSYSSQFESALILIEPLLSSKLDIIRNALSVSHPYIKMTKSICNNPLKWPPELDWSNAWIWISRSVITKQDFFLEGLSKNTLQGDSVCMKWSNFFGFELKENIMGIHVIHKPLKNKEVKIDFLSCPDLVQVSVALAILLKIKFSCSGLQTLVHKETNRFEALIKALKFLGIEVFDLKENHSFSFDSSKWVPNKKSQKVSSLGDHRMAFFWAIIGLKQSIIIDCPETVNKSYPFFWDQWDGIVNRFI